MAGKTKELRALTGLRGIAALVVAPGDELTINNASREEPVEVHVDGRPTLELSPGEDIHVAFGLTHGTLAQLPGASFYHRLRERFGRLAS